MFNKKTSIKEFVNSKEFESFTEYQNNAIKDILFNEFDMAVNNHDEKLVCEVNMETLMGILSFMSYRQAIYDKLTK